MLLFMDGASHYSLAELGEKYTDKSDAFVTWAVVAEGRTDGCIRRTSTTNGNQSGQLTATPIFSQTGVWSPTTTGVFGCALKIDDLSRLAGGGGGFSGEEMANCFLKVQNGNWTMFGLRMNTNGTFDLLEQKTVGATTTLLATSIGGISSGSYVYLECRWKIDSGVSGEVQLKSNGNLILNYTGKVFPNNFPVGAPTVEWNGIKVLNMNSVATPFLVARMCDVYLLDRVASADGANPNDDFLGDLTIAYIKPDGVGAQSGWTPQSGANWTNVDEVPPNDDTDYVETTAAATRDSYTFEDVLSDPKAIQVCNYARKTGVGAASVSVITRQSGVDDDGPAQGIGSESYEYYLQPQDINPHTSLRWTKAQMDAGEWGPLKAT